MAPDPALTALFGTSVGEVGALFVGTSGSASSSAAPKQDSKPSFSKPAAAPVVEEKLELITPSSVVVTAADLQELAEEGVITEEMGKAIWEGLLRQNARTKGKHAAWGRQLIRRLRKGEAAAWPNYMEPSKTTRDHQSDDREKVATTNEDLRQQQIDIADASQSVATAAVSRKTAAKENEVQQKVDKTDEGQSAASTSRKKRSQRGNGTNKSVSEAQSTVEQHPALNALFGDSVGEIGTLFANSSTSFSPGTAPKPPVTSSESRPTPDPVLNVPAVVAKETQKEESSAQRTCVVLIDTFDHLADFETIAASQGISEADLEGDMTIIDAAGKSFTWETFTPVAKFPIKMEFTTRDRKQEKRSDDKGTDENEADQPNKDRHSKMGAAAKKRAAAAKTATGKSASGKPKRR
eukprot:TRINITY_DN6379_c0_g1_i1.p1 TRINITY_DN6379_c0_g1~~TRINITY_DN6379_c0_g1_i1.p1  ORF type:complete len:408 (-),score=92.34 TRINITY_DN6379_c0_g1_i1:487-1710(-)